MNPTYIYALCDPDTGEIRYIGKADDPEFRFKRHIGQYEPKTTHKSNWIKSLLKVGKKPTLRIMEKVDKNNWQEAEKRWIKISRESGANLTNTAEGGIGGATLSKDTLSDKERKRRSDSAKDRMKKILADIRAEHDKNIVME